MSRNVMTILGVGALIVAVAMAAAPSSVGAPAAMPTALTPAANLRVALNNLLTEHVALAASATAGAIGGRMGQFNGAAAALEANSDDVMVADLVKMHILTLKDVIDAQAAGDQMKVYASLRTAMGHMSMVADPLSEAIVKQFPDRFGR